MIRFEDILLDISISNMLGVKSKYTGLIKLLDFYFSDMQHGYPTKINNKFVYYLCYMSNMKSKLYVDTDNVFKKFRKFGITDKADVRYIIISYLEKYDWTVSFIDISLNFKRDMHIIRTINKEKLIYTL